MKIRQLGSAVGSSNQRQHLTTFLINDTIAIDAGSLGLLDPVADQFRVKQVFLSHSHLDHVATLAMFLDNVYQPGDVCPRIYASSVVGDALQNDLFNDRLWPDLARISGNDSPFFCLEQISSESPIEMDGLTITPVAVDHVVPTLGFLIEDQHSAAVIASDTAPTERIWELVNEPRFRSKLQVVFLECSFPDSHEWLAHSSKHLCSRQFAKEIAKVSASQPFLTVAVHLKASLYERTARELAALTLQNLQIGGGDATWEF